MAASRAAGRSPRTVAAAHHISPSHLYRLFEDEDLTVGALIRQQRLERALQGQADLVAWADSLPPGSPSHYDVPFAFKVSVPWLGPLTRLAVRLPSSLTS